MEHNTKEKIHEFFTEPYNLFSKSLWLTCCKKWYLRYMASFHLSNYMENTKERMICIFPERKQEVKNPMATLSHRYARSRSCRETNTFPIHYQTQSRKEGNRNKANLMFEKCFRLEHEMINRVGLWRHWCQGLRQSMHIFTVDVGNKYRKFKAWMQLNV